MTGELKDTPDKEINPRTSKTLIRFCKTNMLIPYGPASEIPDDVIEKLAKLPDDELKTYLENYDYETGTKTRDENEPDIRTILQSVK